MSAVIVTTGFEPRQRARTETSPPGATHRVGVPEPSSAARTRLRLTRRGRVVLTTLAAIPVVVWAMVVVLGAGGAAADAERATERASLAYITVLDGDSLWSIAEAIAPEADPREIIADIIRINGLGDALVEPGQRLALPVVP